MPFGVQSSVFESEEKQTAVALERTAWQFVRSSSVRTRFVSELVVVVALSACVSGMQAEKGIFEAFVVVASAFHAVEPGRTYLCTSVLVTRCFSFFDVQPQTLNLGRLADTGCLPLSDCQTASPQHAHGRARTTQAIAARRCLPHMRFTACHG